MMNLLRGFSRGAFCGLLAATCFTDSRAAVPHAPRIEGVEILADQGWTNNPNTIWYDSFDEPGSLDDRYFEVRDNGLEFGPISYEALGGSGQSIRSGWQPGQSQAGNLKMTFGRNPIGNSGSGVRQNEDFNEIYWRHYLKHEEGWIGNPQKLSRVSAFASSNWSQAMVAHVWGGGSNNIGHDPARGVDANSQVVTTGWNDVNNFTWLDFQQGSTQIFDTAESGRWVSIEGHVKLNSPGNSDGEFTLWIDGQLEITRNDLNWVNSWDNYGINAVFLENFWNNGSPVEQERFFDDFVISTAPIGLAKSPLNPLVTKTSFSDPDAADSQSAWRLQIATDIDGTDIVWDSGQITSAGLDISVNSTNGDFVGSLVGKDQLLPSHLYALRVQQSDIAGNWSEWSEWSTSLQTSSIADFNGDGTVDAIDLGVWSTNYGSAGGMGDSDADGDVDGNDFLAWQREVSATVPLRASLSSTVPEPSALVLVTIAVAILASTGCRL